MQPRTSTTPLRASTVRRRHERNRIRGLQRWLGWAGGLCFAAAVVLMTLGLTVAGLDSFCLGCSLLIPALPLCSGWTAITLTQATLAAESAAEGRDP